MENSKIGFFKRVIISIKDFEKYDMFALEDWKNSLKYLFTLILIFSIIATLAYGYKVINGGLEDIVKPIAEEFNEQIINVEEMQKIVEENYVIFFIVTFLSILTAYFLSTFVDAAMLAILGIIVARIVRMRIKYTGAFNIGAHALTLPIILQIIYLVINLLTGFEVKYFQWMYATISYIYVVVAILMIKTQFINQQQELMKIQLEQDKIRQELQNEDDEPKDEEKKDKKDEKQDEEDKDNNIGKEPEGNNA